jgi:hypothetical protein
MDSSAETGNKKDVNARDARKAVAAFMDCQLLSGAGGVAVSLG